jgi:8-oxo-dGTP pyrophosphatase MutT (NUDIX family)
MLTLKSLTGFFHKAEQMQRYVSTVILSEDLKSIVVIRKNRPANLAGKLNAVGGHIEPGEGIYDAAVREIKEETSLVIDRRNLDMIGNLSDMAYTWDVACFATVLNRDELLKARTETDEKVEVWNIATLLNEPTVDEDFKHLVYESLRLKSKQVLYDGSRNIRFTRLLSN